MEALLSLQEDVIKLKERNKGEFANELYEVLIKTGEEVLNTINETIRFRQTMTFHKGLDALLDEVSECIDDIHQVYIYVEQAPIQTIRIKRLFETLDEAMGGIDDFIENVNELFEEQGFKLDYIESWDIAFFMERM